MQEKDYAGQEAIDNARDLVVLKLQDMYEVVTRDMMSETMRYRLFLCIYISAYCSVFSVKHEALGRTTSKSAP